MGQGTLLENGTTMAGYLTGPAPTPALSTKEETEVEEKENTEEKEATEQDQYDRELDLKSISLPSTLR